jgi:hypothetical protein
MQKRTKRRKIRLPPLEAYLPQASLSAEGRSEQCVSAFGGSSERKNQQITEEQIV